MKFSLSQFISKRIYTIFVLIVLLNIILTIQIENDKVKKKKMSKKASLKRMKMLKRLENTNNIDEKKVIIYRILSYDSKLSLVLQNAGIIPNTTNPEFISNTNIINQLRDFFETFKDDAGALDARSKFDISLTDGFKTLSEKYKFEFKNSTAPAAAKRKIFKN